MDCVLHVILYTCNALCAIYYEAENQISHIMYHIYGCLYFVDLSNPSRNRHHGKVSVSGHSHVFSNYGSSPPLDPYVWMNTRLSFPTCTMMKTYTQPRTHAPNQDWPLNPGREAHADKQKQVWVGGSWDSCLVVLEENVIII